MNNARQDFAMMIAHDLRGPLTVIRGAVAEMEEGNDSRDVRERLRVATQILSEHTEMIIDSARLDAGEYRSEWKEIDVSDELERMCVIATALARNKKLQVTCEIHSPMKISVDATAFRHIVQNLLENAVKYTDEGNVAVTCVQKEGSIEVRVVDTGIGISAEDLKHMFEPFHRGASDDIRTRTGSGMGLWMCRRFAEAAGGSVRMESAGVGQGTVAVMVLPIRSSGEGK